MSARKVIQPDVFKPVTVAAQTTQLDLPARAVRIRKNGIEFRSGHPIPVWAEMTVALQAPLDPRKVNFTGVVVACNGSRHAGYMVSMVFTSLSKQAQARLNSLSASV
jgi:hypothetical protein